MATQKRPIRVTMASWPPRINYVERSVRSLLDQTVVPDSIEINLSRVEFPNGIADLPEGLKELVKASNGKVVVNWEDGNSFVFRKEVPVVKKYHGTDTVMLSCDDDIFYERGFVEYIVSKLGDHDAYNEEPGVVGYKQAVNLRKYTPEFWEALNPEVIKCGISDTWHFWYLQKIKADCQWGPRDTKIRELCRGVACDVLPNSERIGGYTLERCQLADRLSRKALGL